MRRDVRALIYDIQKAIQFIERYTEGLDFDSYQENGLVQHGTERNFITIGEAIRRMRLLGEDVNNRIDGIAAAADFRNVLVHEYEKVDNRKVWRIITESLPILKEQINTWADELGMEPLPGQTA